MYKVKKSFIGNTTVPIITETKGQTTTRLVHLDEDTSQEDLALVYAAPLCKDFVELQKKEVVDGKK